MAGFICRFSSSRSLFPSKAPAATGPLHVAMVATITLVGVFCSLPTAARRKPRKAAIRRQAGGQRKKGTDPGKASAQKTRSDPQLSADSVLILKNAEGRVLYAKNANTLRSIASLTKLMVALVIRSRRLDLNGSTAITRVDHQVGLGGCRTRLELNWVYRNRDLLHAMMLASDNRAVSALGRAAGLSPNALVQAMNEFARKMGLTKTRFHGPAGIDHENRSTAWEVSRIVRRATKDTDLRAVMSKRDHRVRPVKGYLAVNYRNTNPLVGTSRMAKFVGSKTGFNDAAGYCLAAVADLPGAGEVTVVLLGSKSKYERVRDTRRALRFARRKLQVTMAAAVR